MPLLVPGGERLYGSAQNHLSGMAANQYRRPAQRSVVAGPRKRPSASIGSSANPSQAQKKGHRIGQRDNANRHVGLAKLLWKANDPLGPPPFLR
jgi:hypothetical protein